MYLVGAAYMKGRVKICVSVWVVDEHEMGKVKVSTRIFPNDKVSMQMEWSRKKMKICMRWENENSAMREEMERKMLLFCPFVLLYFLALMHLKFGHVNGSAPIKNVSYTFQYHKNTLSIILDNKNCHLIIEIYFWSLSRVFWQ